MFRLICALLFLFAAAVHASTTAAWKVPVELYASLSGEGSRKLTAPPGASVFFQPGDELWDIAEQIMGHSPASLHDRGEKPEPWPGEWLVWNARSGMIVARGSEIDLLLLDQTLDVFEKIPLLLRTKFEMVQGPAAETRILSLISKNGTKSQAKLQDLAVEMSTAYEPGPGSPVDLGFSISWPREKNRWEFSSTVALRHGERTRIAVHDSEEDHWELFLTASKEWFHAVPHEDIRWKEEGSRVVRWPEPASERFAVEDIGNGLQAGAYRIPFAFLDGIEDDPLGVETKANALSNIQPPDSMAGWIRGEIADVRELLRNMGMKSSFAGYDQRRELLFLVATPTYQELAQMLFHPPGCSFSKGVWTELVRDSSSLGIASISGSKAMIRKTGGDRKIRFEIEATSGFHPQIDCRYSFDIMERKDMVGSLSSQAALRPGVPQVIGSYALPGLEEAKISLSVSPREP